jgi:hypothetical protein
MKYNVVEVIRLPRDQVFPVYPDLLRARAHLLPSVEKCVVLERIEDGHLVRMRTSWTARADVIPAFIRNALPEGSIGWIDNAVWNNAKFRADWSHDIPILRGAVENKGYTQFVDDGDETIIEVHGDLTVHPDRFPLVPTAIARRLAPSIEQLIVSNLEKNLRQNNENVARYLEEEVG